MALHTQKVHVGQSAQDISDRLKNLQISSLLHVRAMQLYDNTLQAASEDVTRSFTFKQVDKKIDYCKTRKGRQRNQTEFLIKWEGLHL